jgi:hypothetical protein
LLANELEVLVSRAPEQWHLLQPNWPSDREPGVDSGSGDGSHSIPDSVPGGSAGDDD